MTAPLNDSISTEYAGKPQFVFTYISHNLSYVCGYGRTVTVYSLDLPANFSFVYHNISPVRLACAQL